MPYEAKLEWLSENLCRGEHDPGLTGSNESRDDSLWKMGLAVDGVWTNLASSDKGSE